MSKLGTIKFISEERNFGFITADDKVDYFFLLGNEILSKGDRVEFTAESAPRGPRAVNVRPL
jgi:cold shock CspA family protein